jgi:hypothetical protein
MRSLTLAASRTALNRGDADIATRTAPSDERVGATTARRAMPRASSDAARL